MYWCYVFFFFFDLSLTLLSSMNLRGIEKKKRNKKNQVKKNIFLKISSSKKPLTGSKNGTNVKKGYS